MPTDIINSSETLTERQWCAKEFCFKVFFVCCGSCIHSVSYVSCWVNIFSSANYIMLPSLGKYFSTTIFSGWILDGSLVLRGSLFTQFFRTTISWRHISQGRVKMRLRCDGIFNYHFIMVALCNRADHYIFALWFLSSSLLSSPNLSGRRLDVYHTSTHGVALVWI